MNPELDFQFYSALSEGDAEPFVTEGLLAVADGFFAGSSAVVSDERFYLSESAEAFRHEIFARALPEYDEQKHAWLAPYLNRRSGFAGGPPPFWGSRIALARCVFALRELDGYLENLDDESARESLAEFIHKGLADTAVLLAPEPEPLGGRAILPSTLTALAYCKSGETVTAEVIWAGNARAYAWTVQGLHLLTNDDGCGTDGAVANLFSADRTAADLNYQRVELPHPCVLFAVTDGAFRAYGDDEFRELLIDLLKSADTPEQFSGLLKAHYDCLGIDDASGAFAPVGFGSFLQIKEKLIPKTHMDEYDRIVLFVSDPANAQTVANGLLADACPDDTDPWLCRAFSDLKTAAQNLAGAKAALEGYCRMQSGIAEVERTFLETISKRLQEIRKERGRLERERAENAAEQKDVFHVKMARREKKIRFLQAKLKPLSEEYRQSCNPRGCSQCGPRCSRYLARPGQLSEDIRIKLQEQSVYIGEYYALRDWYLTLHSELARLDNRDYELEREDYELQRFLLDYEAGAPIDPQSFKSGSAQVFAGRIGMLGDRAAVLQSIAEAEKNAAEKTALYETAVEVFFGFGQLIKRLADRLFRTEALSGK